MLTTMTRFPASYLIRIPIPSTSAMFSSKSIPNTNLGSLVHLRQNWHFSPPTVSHLCPSSGQDVSAAKCCAIASSTSLLACFVSVKSRRGILCYNLTPLLTIFIQSMCYYIFALFMAQVRVITYSSGTIIISPMIMQTTSHMESYVSADPSYAHTHGTTYQSTKNWTLPLS